MYPHHLFSCPPPPKTQSIDFFPDLFLPLLYSLFLDLFVSLTIFSRSLSLSLSLFLTLSSSLPLSPSLSAQLSDFDIQRLIAHGTEGAVFLVTCQHPRQTDKTKLYALKVMFNIFRLTTVTQVKVMIYWCGGGGGERTHRWLRTRSKYAKEWTS